MFLLAYSEGPMGKPSLYSVLILRHSSCYLHRIDKLRQCRCLFACKEHHASADLCRKSLINPYITHLLHLVNVMREIVARWIPRYLSVGDIPIIFICTFIDKWMISSTEILECNLVLEFFLARFCTKKNPRCHSCNFLIRFFFFGI